MVIGARGEEIAAAWLRRKGFRIDALNWRAGRTGEIDIVAFEPVQSLLALVEVKTRRLGATRLGTPLEAVTPRKRQRLIALAEAYLHAHPGLVFTDMRFDVIGIVFPGSGRPAEITHLEGAFDA